MTRIGIIREGKTPPDHRTPFTPQQCQQVMRLFPGTEIVVQPSPHRCFSDEAYQEAGIPVQEDLSDCDILMGIKEVPVAELIPEKKYLFFSHTIKKQSYNRPLLRAILQHKIALIDYEVLEWDNGSRILGFGRFAGIVGMHNGFRTWGLKTKDFDLKPAFECTDYDDMKAAYQDIKLPPIKIAVCGDGRVAHGSLELLESLQIREVTRKEFINQTYDEPVYVHLRSEDYYARKDGREWDKADFYHNPEYYESTFAPYAQHCDLMVNAIYWKHGIPAFFSKEEMRSPDFSIKVIADITCDINGPLPSTIRDTTIEDPVYGYHPFSESETEPYQEPTVDVMAVSNLPCELPVDASTEFGEQLVNYVMAHLLHPSGTDKIIAGATIAAQGYLTEKFSYLQDYVA